MEDVLIGNQIVLRGWGMDDSQSYHHYRRHRWFSVTAIEIKKS